MSEETAPPDFPIFMEMTLLPMAIGQAVIEWNQTERNLLRLMEMLRKSPPRKLTNHEYNCARDEWLDKKSDSWLRALCDILECRSSASFAGDLSSIISAYPVALASRHNIIHGYYGGFSESGNRQYKRKPFKESQSERQINSRDVWSWLNDIRKLNSKSISLEIKINKGDYTL